MMMWWEKAYSTFTVCVIAVVMTVVPTVMLAADEAVPQTPMQGEEQPQSRGALPLQRLAPTEQKSPPPLLGNPQFTPITPTSSPCELQFSPDFAGKPYVQPTHFLMVSPATFRLGAKYDHYFVIGSGMVRAWRDARSPSDRITLTAPVLLPQGVVVRQIEVFLRDDDPMRDVSFSFFENSLTAQARPVMGSRGLVTVSNCINSNAPGSDVMRITGLALPIDNMRAAYSLKLNWEAEGVTNVSNYSDRGANAGIEVNLIRIGYTLQ